MTTYALEISSLFTCYTTSHNMVLSYFYSTDLHCTELKKLKLWAGSCWSKPVHAPDPQVVVTAHLEIPWESENESHA
jgi:hypothetical protein